MSIYKARPQKAGHRTPMKGAVPKVSSKTAEAKVASNPFYSSGPLLTLGLGLQTKSTVAAENEPSGQEADNIAAHVMKMPDTNTIPTIQRKPAEVTAATFMGRTVGGGVNATMSDRLSDVETELESQFNTEHGRAHTDNRELQDWAGLNSIRGWRTSSSTTSKHCSGSAVDVNYDNQPYIVTRTTTGTNTEYGGERAGRALTDQRVATVEVFDRAMDFVYGGASADVRTRRPADTTTTPATPEETTSAVYRRFRNVSDALATYLSLAFLTTPSAVRRRPIADIEGATNEELLAAIPTTERKDEATGIEDIRQYILNHEFSTSALDNTYHWSWEDSFLAEGYYYRMLRDYEHVRIPMVRGNPAARPTNTRNPARGFLDMPEHFVVAMRDTGNLRWGISDLGEAESGDTHHFDLGNHGGVTPDCTE